ncbi:hypothetical protein B0H11DRAFT_573863 [Mycena galericulata]|nr:hypothetical protein B0H11DRAFT_573863 [Mycena galericulata]
MLVIHAFKALIGALIVMTAVEVPTTLPAAKTFQRARIIAIDGFKRIAETLPRPRQIDCLYLDSWLGDIVDLAECWETQVQAADIISIANDRNITGSTLYSMSTPPFIGPPCSPSLPACESLVGPEVLPTPRSPTPLTRLPTPPTLPSLTAPTLRSPTPSPPPSPATTPLPDHLEPTETGAPLSPTGEYTSFSKLWEILLSVARNKTLWFIVLSSGWVYAAWLHFFPRDTTAERPERIVVQLDLTGVVDTLDLGEGLYRVWWAAPVEHPVEIGDQQAPPTPALTYALLADAGSAAAQTPPPLPTVPSAFGIVSSTSLGTLSSRLSAVSSSALLSASFTSATSPPLPAVSTSTMTSSLDAMSSTSSGTLSMSSSFNDTFDDLRGAHGGLRPRDFVTAPATPSAVLLRAPPPTLASSQGTQPATAQTTSPPPTTPSPSTLTASSSTESEGTVNDTFAHIHGEGRPVPGWPSVRSRRRPSPQQAVVGPSRRMDRGGRPAGTSQGRQPKEAARTGVPSTIPQTPVGERQDPRVAQQVQRYGRPGAALPAEWSVARHTVRGCPGPVQRTPLQMRAIPEVVGQREENEEEGAYHGGVCGENSPPRLSAATKGKGKAKEAGQAI